MTDVKDDIENPQPTLVYEYAAVDPAWPELMVYKGTPTEVRAGEEAPANSTHWAPNENIGTVPYFDGEGWVPGIPLNRITLSEAQRVAEAAAAEAFQAEVESINAGYSAAERAVWADQVAAATDVVAGRESSILTALAEARGVDVETLALKILDKDAAYKATYFKALGAYQKKRDEIGAATKVTQLSFTLDMVRRVRSSGGF
ncbi:TPA: hypothetical protein ACP7Q5_004789 [Escherichia coli]|jgi:hypothetical protein|uniref:Uncharacterized protein n=7 Tax=root TaxID=1 RepID=A0A8S5UIE3_9CAUD|nr:hypothetical protein [Enterococcus faecalis]ELG7156147.1 hypothetical protein [Staphylococcus aureus]DAF94150.1 MAG TPA: hypothetical protein [Myoviridae sp. ctu2j3]HDW3906855.1 hypothetical protein [Escherichia coli]HEH8886012.1 hypothetical protein [Salmonella enterica]ELL1201417.1 hypothetical protein [Staphylococcus aureus]